MSIKNGCYFILIILFISNSFSSFNESFKSLKKWDEETLFEYIKYKYLTPNNETNNIPEFHFMIIDPNEYLTNNDYLEIKKNLEKLYTQYNITSFIYIINYLKKNTDLNYKLKDFNNKIFSEIYKYKKNFDEYSTISAIFQIEDNKMNIRLGSACRSIISDSESLQILKDNYEYLSSKQIGNLLTKFTSSFVNKYIYNYNQSKKNSKNKFNFLFQILTFKGIIILSILILVYSLLIYFCFFHKFSENKIANTLVEKNIEKFIKTNKDESINNINKIFCIICLNKYDSDEILTSSNDYEKINLPCGHCYHQQCLYKYFKLNDNNNKLCPLCKTKFKIKFDDSNEKIHIKSYIINNIWEDNNNNFDCFINEFISVQKLMNPFDIKDEFCDKMIKIYNNPNLENSTVKIKNY